MPGILFYYRIAELLGSLWDKILPLIFLLSFPLAIFCAYKILWGKTSLPTVSPKQAIMLAVPFIVVPLTFALGEQFQTGHYRPLEHLSDPPQLVASHFATFLIFIGFALDLLVIYLMKSARMLAVLICAVQMWMSFFAATSAIIRIEGLWI